MWGDSDDNNTKFSTCMFIFRSVIRFQINFMKRKIQLKSWYSRKIWRHRNPNCVGKENLPERALSLPYFKTQSVTTSRFQSSSEQNKSYFINVIPLSHLVIYDCFISVSSYKFSSTISLGKKRKKKNSFFTSNIYNVLAVTSMKANRIINQEAQ